MHVLAEADHETIPGAHLSLSVEELREVADLYMMIRAVWASFLRFPWRAPCSA